MFHSLPLFFLFSREGFILHALDLTKAFEGDSNLYRFREDFRDPKKQVAGPYTFFTQELI